MQKTNKARTFIGFSIKSGKCKIGLNAASFLKKAYLVVVCRKTGKDTVKQAQKLAKRWGCPVLQTVSYDLSEYTCKGNPRVIAIFDRTLAKAVKDNSANDFNEIG